MDNIKQKLDEISNYLSKCSEIDASAIVDKNGIVVSSCTNLEGDAGIFGMISAVMFGAANIAFNESGIGPARRITVYSEHTMLITENTNSQMLLSILTNNQNDIDDEHSKMQSKINKVKSAIENTSK